MKISIATTTIVLLSIGGYARAGDESCTWCGKNKIVCKDELAYQVCLSDGSKCGQSGIKLGDSIVKDKKPAPGKNGNCPDPDPCTWCGTGSKKIVCKDELAYKVCLSDADKCGDPGIKLGDSIVKDKELAPGKHDICKKPDPEPEPCTWCGTGAKQIVCDNDKNAYKVCLSDGSKCGESGIKLTDDIVKDAKPKSNKDFICEKEPCTWCGTGKQQIVCDGKDAYKVCLSPDKCGESGIKINSDIVKDKKRKSNKDFLCEGGGDDGATCTKGGDMGYWCDGKDFICKDSKAYKVCLKDKGDCGKSDPSGIVDRDWLVDKDDECKKPDDDYPTCRDSKGNKGYWCSGKDFVCKSSKAYKVCLEDMDDCGKSDPSGIVDTYWYKDKDDECKKPDEDYPTCRNSDGDKGYWCSGKDDELVCWEGKAFKVCLKDKDKCGKNTWSGEVDDYRMKHRDELCEGGSDCGYWKGECLECSKKYDCYWEDDWDDFKDCIEDDCRSKCEKAYDECDYGKNWKHFAGDCCWKYY